MKFFASMALGMSVMIGLECAEVPTEPLKGDFFILQKPDFDTLYEFPVDTCIVTIDGDSRTFDSYVDECLSRKHPWLRVSSGRRAF